MLVISEECSIVSFQNRDSIGKALDSCHFDLKHPLITEEKVCFYERPKAPTLPSATIILAASKSFKTPHEIQGEILKFNEFQILPLGIIGFLNLLRVRDRLPLCFKIICLGDYCHPKISDNPLVFSVDAYKKRKGRRPISLWLEDAMRPFPPYTWVPCLSLVP
jgi:hypothetical protein